MYERIHTGIRGSSGIWLAPETPSISPFQSLFRFISISRATSRNLRELLPSRFLVLIFPISQRNHPLVVRVSCGLTPALRALEPEPIVFVLGSTDGAGGRIGYHR